MIAEWKCGVLAVQQVNQIFFFTLYSEQHSERSLVAFFYNVRDKKNQYTFFQQYGATSHTASNWMFTLHNIFGEWIICHSLWSAFSFHLGPYGSYLWGFFKDNFYKHMYTHTHTQRITLQKLCHTVSVISKHFRPFLNCSLGMKHVCELQKIISILL